MLLNIRFILTNCQPKIIHICRICPLPFFFLLKCPIYTFANSGHFPFFFICQFNGWNREHTVLIGISLLVRLNILSYIFGHLLKHLKLLSMFYIAVFTFIWKSSLCITNLHLWSTTLLPIFPTGLSFALLFNITWGVFLVCVCFGVFLFICFLFFGVCVCVLLFICHFESVSRKRQEH